MALTLRLSIGTPCSGGNHFAVTGIPTPGVARAFDFTRQELRSPVLPDEMETFARVLIRLYANQLNGQTPAQMKTAIEAKTLDLTVS